MNEENLSNQSAPKRRPFNVGDVVYLLYTSIRYAEREQGLLGLPYINTNKEIDCKILAIYSDPGRPPRASLVSGTGTQFCAMLEELIHASEYPQYSKSPKITALEDTELFLKGTVFLRSGEYWVNDQVGVYLHNDRFKTIKHLFV